MIEFIVQASNQKGKSVYSKNWKATDETELFAWIGLVLRAELDHDNFRPVNEPFSIKIVPHCIVLQ